jgi:hypothetical protein
MTIPFKDYLNSLKMIKGPKRVEEVYDILSE